MSVQGQRNNQPLLRVETVDRQANGGKRRDNGDKERNRRLVDIVFRLVNLLSRGVELQAV